MQFTQASASALALVIGALAISTAALSQDQSPAETQQPTELSRNDLEAFLQPLMTEQLEKNKVAGAVVAVVKGGELLFSKGYGFADVAERVPMTPDTTLVRPGSISKLFTAVAVMQLAEQGKLDIDSDINGYIDFVIPTPPLGVPVTLRRLMTHRAGFEEQYKELITFQAAPRALGEWLKTHQPPRLYPNGNVSSYSNYGVALAGYVVERVSGLPFAQYVDNNIFEPLGMTRSTMAVPPPSDKVAAVSQAYWTADQPPLPGYEMVPATGAGSLAATAEDMTRFMRALLNGGELNGRRILEPETLREMLAPQVKTPAGEMGLQFVTFQFGGRDYFGHTGGTIAVYSNFIFLPDENFGLFVSFNSASSGRALVDLPRKIAERYFPKPLPAPLPLTTEQRQAKLVDGVYVVSQRMESNLMKVLSLLSQMKVTALPDGRITRTSALGLGGDNLLLAEIAPGVFRAENGTRTAFAPNTDHGGTTMQVSPPAIEFHRVEWHQDARIVLPLVMASVLVALLTTLCWPVAAHLRLKRQSPFSADQSHNNAYVMTRVVGALNSAIMVTLIVVAVWIGSDVSKLDGRLDSVFAGMFAIAWLAVLSAPAVVYFVFRFWRDRIGSRWSRTHHGLLAASSVILAWFYVNYHIAGTTLLY